MRIRREEHDVKGISSRNFKVEIDANTSRGTALRRGSTQEFQKEAPTRVSSENRDERVGEQALVEKILRRILSEERVVRKESIKRLSKGILDGTSRGEFKSNDRFNSFRQMPMKKITQQ